jgi:hypothetical protein
MHADLLSLFKEVNYRLPTPQLTGDLTDKVTGRWLLATHFTDANLESNLPYIESKNKPATEGTLTFDAGFETNDYHILRSEAEELPLNTLFKDFPVFYWNSRHCPRHGVSDQALATFLGKNLSKLTLTDYRITYAIIYDRFSQSGACMYDAQRPLFKCNPYYPDEVNASLPFTANVKFNAKSLEDCCAFLADYFQTLHLQGYNPELRGTTRDGWVGQTAGKVKVTSAYFPDFTHSSGVQARLSAKGRKLQLTYIFGLNRTALATINLPSTDFI